jgi:hypothetical protein
VRQQLEPAEPRRAAPSSRREGWRIRPPSNVTRTATKPTLNRPYQGDLPAPSISAGDSRLAAILTGASPGQGSGGSQDSVNRWYATVPERGVTQICDGMPTTARIVLEMCTSS